MAARARSPRSAKPGPDPDTSAPPNERRNRDSEVMAAAIRLIYEKGYVGASLQDVANEVGVLKGSLYYYFASKEDLLVRIMKESHVQAEEIYREIAATDLPPSEKLSKFVAALMTWYLEHTEQVSIYINERHRLTGERLEEVEAEGRRFERMIHDFIRDAKKAGDIDDQIDTKLAVQFIVGALNSVPMWKKWEGASPDEVAQQFAQTTLKSIAR
ncbi:TetR/AcrR family transcriptional regulator [Rhodococcus aetherivorans]|uniref:TetR/AcrR family transcriptional regulator n=1 Tax=Rhodococcus aetherivorans TaxID=191292 RepID=UPI00365E965A